MSTKFLSPGWRMPRNANQSKQSNYSMEFVGSSEYINAGSTPQALVGSNSAYTVSAWVKPDTTGNLNIIGAMDSGNRWYFRVLNGHASYAYGAASGGNDYQGTATPVALNIWSHVMFTFDGSTTHKIYVNGVLKITQSNGSAQTITNSQNAYIGALNNNGSTQNYFDGSINAVSIFNYALSSSQITTLYGTGSAIGNPMALPRTPIAYYPLGTSAWNGQYLAENNAIGDYVFNFDGAHGDTNVINAGSSLTITRDLTLSGWVRFTATNSGGNTVISKHISGSATPYYTYRLYIESNGAKFRIGTTTYTIITGTTTTLNDGKWHHILGTYDGSNINLYVDGVSNATAVAASGDLNTTVKDTTIGGVISGNTGALLSTTVFNGDLSNTQIFNTALTASEVTTLYNYGSPIQTLVNIPQSSNLKAWYKLDASEIYNSSTTEWEINEATAEYTSFTHSTGTTGSGTQVANIQSWGPTSAITFSVWFKTSESAGSGDPNYFKYLLSAPMNNSVNAGFYIAFYNNSVFTMLRTGGTNNNLSSSVVVNDGKWHHIARTYNGSVSNLYIDGQNASTVDDPQTGSLDYGTDSGNNNLGIGCLFNPSRSYSSNTDVSNVSVWSAGLSSSEITELYNNGQPGNLSSHSATSNLTGWWTLKDASAAAGGGLVDLSSNSNNANTANTDVVPGSVSTLNGESSGMSQANLIQSDLQTVAPYSKYAMSFDSASSSYIDVTNFALSGNKTVSFWVNFGQTPYGSILEGVDGDNYYPFFGSGNIYLNNDGTATSLSYGTVNANEWYHFCITGDGTTATVYKNGSSLGTLGDKNITVHYLNGKVYGIDHSSNNGKLSNIAIWNTVITSSQVREIYNEGLPSNLNTFSGTAPVAWWQLGENSSYVSDWIFADEIGSNDGGGQNLAETALTNGVGTTANGVSTGMAVGALVGNAPYSTANAVSSGMSVVSRVTGSGNTP